jgi:hypothetical protein
MIDNMRQLGVRTNRGKLFAHTEQAGTQAGRRVGRIS